MLFTRRARINSKILETSLCAVKSISNLYSVGLQWRLPEHEAESCTTGIISIAPLMCSLKAHHTSHRTINLSIFLEQAESAVGKSSWNWEDARANGGNWAIRDQFSISVIRSMNAKGCLFKIEAFDCPRQLPWTGKLLSCSCLLVDVGPPGDLKCQLQNRITPLKFRQIGHNWASGHGRRWWNYSMIQDKKFDGM